MEPVQRLVSSVALRTERSEEYLRVQREVQDREVSLRLGELLQQSPTMLVHLEISEQPAEVFCRTEARPVVRCLELHLLKFEGPEQANVSQLLRIIERLQSRVAGLERKLEDRESYEREQAERA